MNAPSIGEEDADEFDLLETIVESGNEVSYQDWDSGGPGAGAGRVSVYKYKDEFYSIHDAGMDDPFVTIEEVVKSAGIDNINDATRAR